MRRRSLRAPARKDGKRRRRATSAPFITNKFETVCLYYLSVCPSAPASLLLRASCGGRVLDGGSWAARERSRRTASHRRSARGSRTRNAADVLLRWCPERTAKTTAQRREWTQENVQVTEKRSLCPWRKSCEEVDPFRHQVHGSVYCPGRLRHVDRNWTEELPTPGGQLSYQLNHCHP